MFRLSLLVLLLNLHAHATNAIDLATQLQQISLDPEECYRVIGLNFAKEDLKIYLNSGYLIFTKPVAGFRSSAVFVANQESGDAELLLMPPVRSERLSLATFTNSPNLNEHFKEAVLVFSDDTANELLSQIQANPSMKKSPEMANLIITPWTSIVRNLTDSFLSRLVNDLIAGDRKSGLFYMAVSGSQLGTFDVLHDPTSHEQIFAGKLSYSDNRTYYDTWTSFPSRSARAGSAAGPKYTLDNFRIDSTIDNDLMLKAVSRFTLTPARPLSLSIPFSISSKMHATGGSIDGHPVEVFQRESIRSNLISSNDNDLILLITETPLDASKPHEIEIRHEGHVIQTAGDGVYFVASRGNWYPRVGTEFAKYDLTFRYPKNLTLVATGGLLDERTDGDWRITRHKTDVPIRFAGFNLGDFQSVSADQKGFKIQVYANRHLESALEPRAPAPSLAAPRRVSGRADPPNPAPRLELLAKNVADALEFMTAQFGPPPLPYLAITPIPGNFGQGFPGLVYLSTVAYLNPEQRPQSLRDPFQETFFSELLEDHETAHQWWGNMVVPAGYQDEWLIESLANYTALLLLEKNKGPQAVDAVLADYKRHLLAKLESGRTLESAGPISWGFRLQSSIAPHAWRTVTYEKGTWIMHMLRRRLGDEKFMAFLRELCSRFRFNTVSTEQFRELAAHYTPPASPDASLKGFFDNWVYGTGIPAVKMTSAFRAMKLTGTLIQNNVDDDFSTFVPVEVRTRTQRTVYWLPTANEPSPFSIPLKVPPTKVALLGTDWLMTIPK